MLKQLRVFILAKEESTKPPFSRTRRIIPLLFFYLQLYPNARQCSHSCYFVRSSSRCWVSYVPTGTANTATVLVEKSCTILKHRFLRPRIRDQRSLYPRILLSRPLSATAQHHALPASPPKSDSGADERSSMPSFSIPVISWPVV